MRFTDAAKQLLKHLEGCRLTAYLDRQDGGGSWTIGWGHVGPEVVDGVSWTQAQADAVLDRDIQRFVTGVSHLTTKAPGLGDAQFSALVLFAYNEGLRALAGSTLLRVVLAGHYDGVPDQLARWIYDHDESGKPVRDQRLVNRRKAEAALWLSDTA